MWVIPENLYEIEYMWATLRCMEEIVDLKRLISHHLYHNNRFAMDDIMQVITQYNWCVAARFPGVGMLQSMLSLHYYFTDRYLELHELMEATADNRINELYNAEIWKAVQQNEYNHCMAQKIWLEFAGWKYDEISDQRYTVLELQASRFNASFDRYTTDLNNSLILKAHRADFEAAFRRNR